jgi:two-component system phosphate regulon sensor histidine kinase PhoR
MMRVQAPSLKTPTPNQISLVCSLGISIPASLFFQTFIQRTELSILFFALLFLLGFLLIKFTINRFLDRQIKLIYKLISQTKASKREAFYFKSVLPQKTIDEVREDAARWSEHHLNIMEKLEQNDKFRKEFLQNLSHELKTPIFSIQGYVDTLLDGAFDDPETRMKFLRNAEKNIERLASLVQDLDQITKLEQGELSLNYQTYIIQDLFKEICEGLEIKFLEHKINWQIKKGCERSLWVYADKDKIRQVLTNLVDNAIKYGKQNGVVEGSFYLLSNKKILIEITDDGQGIQDEHLPRIFERFYRTDEARSRKIGGSGLGLAICKHILEAHGEFIHVRSTPDVGTTIGFELPQSKSS